MAFWPANTPATVQPSNTVMGSSRDLIPGQTAPRLIATIKQVDRRSGDPLERNPFTDPPRGYNELLDENRKNQRVLGSCKHYWTTQLNQSVLPGVERGLRDSRHRIACFCQHCRWHVDITTTCFERSCPSHDAPLHHFIDFRKLDEQQEWYSAKCSSCAATLDIEYRGPRLTQEDVALLTDTARLQRRFRIAKEKDPDRVELKVAPPLMVLDALACYIRDSLKPKENHRAIPRLNRRFLLSFGEDCEPLLKKLEFVQTEETWQLPQPPPEDPWLYDLRQLLQDVQEELWALMRAHMQTPHQHNLKDYHEKPEAFDNDIQLLLSTIEYDKCRVARRTPLLSQDEERWHAGLGSMGDFSDELLLYAFDRQIVHDPAGTPYYYDCLSKLANKKQSETLEIKVMTLASEGYFGREDVAKAYKYFALDAWDAPNYTDAYIRNTFEARLGSVQSWQETEMRQMLRVIALSRGSRELEGAAANDVQTAEQALKWLAPSHNDSFTLDDDQISSLATVKHDDATDSAEREKVKTAVRLIAEQRDSFALHAWQPNGNGSSDDDELTQAYKYYNIDDRSGFLDKDVLQTMLTMRQQDPDATLKGQQDAQKHYDVLLKNTNGNSNAPKAADYNNPVGLNNMGNTCYLNSLLQYFYTIKPFRDIVTNFNDHKQPLDDTILDSSLGRVGGMIVNRAEVKAAQEFLPELATLFDQMATAPGPEVSPEWKLACLALKQSPGLQKGPPRRATIVSPRPSNVLPATNGSTIAPPGNGPPTPESPAVSIDGSSDVTLIGDIVLTPDSDADDVQKESAMKVEPSGENVSLLTDGADGGHERADSMEVEDGTLCPPSRPPPVPPRPKTTTDSWKSEAETAAKQHDVQEVVTNLQNKALCAIKADGTDGNGNRNDKIKELFYTTSRHIYPGKELADEITIFNTAIINLHDKPLDICEALDINFGREDVDDKGKVVKRYQTVLEPAPFLQIYFQNQDYKPITRADGTIEGYEARLIQHHVKLPEIINMDRYMENSSPELLQLRQRSWELQEHRKALRTEHAALLATNIDGLEGPDALDATWQFINELGDELDDTFVVKENIKAEVEQRRSKIEGATKKIEQIDKELYSLSFDKFDTSEHAYKLFAVFVHRGTSSFGHYWIYIHDFVNGIWRKYEDSTVSVVTDLAEIFEAKDSRTQGVPNFVVYVKNDRKDELTDVLHRVKPETVEGGDLEMADVTQPQIESQNISAKQVCIDADEALARKIQIDLDEEYARTSQEQLYSGVSPPLAGGVVVAVKEFDSWNDKDHWGKDRPLPADRPRRPSKKGRKGVDTVRSVMGFERGRRSRRNDKESGELFGGLWANPGHKGYEADGESDASDADSDKKEPRVTIE